VSGATRARILAAMHELGYRRALQAAGLPVRGELQRVGPHGRAVAHRLTRELLSLPEPPTAIFAASDTQALGVLEAAGVEGFDVPGDRRGLERLVSALRGEDAGRHEERLEVSLKVRWTTGPPG
jgi:DNA-binding LacI/PurR family transcriptional regulator